MDAGDRTGAKAGYAEGVWPKRCGKCGKEYDQGAWEKLPCVGRSNVCGETLEYRNCPCHTTLAVDVV